MWLVNPSNMQKKRIAGIALLVLVILAVYSFQTYKPKYAGEVKATLIIENGVRTQCEVTLPAGSNVEDLMTACGIPFEKEPSGFITSINGVSQDASSGRYWLYYVNGELGQVGASQYAVEDGDIITWKLEKI